MSKMSTDLIRQALNGPTMGTRWSALFHAAPGFDPTPVQAALQTAVDAVDLQMSTWSPDSDLMRLNAAPVGAWQDIPADLARILTVGLAIGRASGGAFDVGQGDAVRAWGFGPATADPQAIRDAMLAVSGTLDLTTGGSLLTTKNREFLFNHTSQDKSSYADIRRRSIYVPVIRNHLYDVFQLFDYTDASVLKGDRDTSTIAPQALFLMNSDLVTELTGSMADRLMSLETTRESRINRLFLEAYGRPVTDEEAERASQFLVKFEKLVSQQAGQADAPTAEAWQALCQSIVLSSEFVYIR